MQTRKSILLINLGTPDSPNTSDVRKYLREFLSDPRVIDIPSILRWFLLNFIILPFRPKKSAEAYKKIWQDEGSPLAIYTKELARKLQDEVGKSIPVSYAMRYQNPSIEKAIQELLRRGTDKIFVLPLFPQYSSAANGSAIEKFMVEISKMWNIPDVEIIHDFYDHPAFIKAFGEIGRKHLKQHPADKVLMSFHGLPERHCTKSDESENQSHCLKSPTCCDQIQPANRRCYRAQCYATARALAKELELPHEKWEVAFQSRLGRTPWVKPYTDERLVTLPKEGVKKLAVYCPSFVADCLETLEEISIRANEDFLSNGGEELRLIPSLNSEDIWVKAVKEIIGI